MTWLLLSFLITSVAPILCHHIEKKIAVHVYLRVQHESQMIAFLRKLTTCA